VSRTPDKPTPRAYGDGSIFQRKSDGRWIVKVVENGKRVQLGSSKDESAARQILEAYAADQAAGLKPSARDWLTADWLEYWLTTKEPQYDRAGNRTAGVQPTTFEKYETQIRRHILPYIGKVLPADLVTLSKAPETILRWQKILNGKVGADVQIEALQRLSSALDLAVGHDLIARNPADKKRGIVKPPERPVREYVEPSELDLVRLLRNIDGDPLEALVWIALATGLRRAEVAGLDWADIRIFSDDRGEIRAHRRVNRLGQRAQARLNLDGGRLEREGLKSRKQLQRVLPIGAQLIGILRQRQHIQLAERTVAGTRWRGPAYAADQPSGYVFTNSVGMPLEPDRITKFMARLDLTDTRRFHALRRLFTTLMSMTGAPDHVTMKLGGWSDAKMLHYYQNSTDTQEQVAMARVDAELGRLHRIARGGN
jgi:integrase